ncbi:MULTISPECIES: MFS transporter [Gordonibacter]|uniref:MFS transporter n=1 Tax=Gordonibacter faecis TaxID=3047475 RepID=A0ABT7DN84_9ACTN|nr:MULTISPECIES: MFS transporter [unclassified Gordonibacter]MDJ1650994.1 MFS transporter [Gordonibacter sp. KGMB12511]HIW76958.1 MFS transporter [Candidatus Gordonibacter avicola]
MGYSKGRKTAAAVGVTLILASASGGTSVMNAIVPFLLEGMQVNLTTFMIGPTVATILSFAMSAVGVKIIDIISPKWCMLIGSVCSALTMYMVGTATSFVFWIIANILNGIVLAFATYAAAGGVVAVFYGENTQKAFGVVGGLTALLVAAWMAVTSVLLNVMPYSQLFTIYSVGIVVIGVFCNLVLIGKIPRRKLAAKAEGSGPASAPAEDIPGYTFAETLKKGASIYFFLIAMFLVAWCASGITSYASVYYTSFGMAATTAAAMLSLYSFAAAFLKLASGFILKKIGAKAMSIMIYLGFALGIGCLLIWSQTQLFPLAVIGIVLCAFISYSTMIPGLFVPDLYGMKDYTGINSAGLAGYYLGAVTVLFGLSIVIGFLGYFNAFVVLAVAALVTMGFMLAAVVTSPFKAGKERQPKEIKS